MEYKDYYDILGIARDADQTTIKRAYRRMARTYHPDVYPDKVVGEQRFKEINEAYTVLSDPEKRRTYDRFGTQWERYRRAGMRPEDRYAERAKQANGGAYPGAGWRRSGAAGSGQGRSYGYATMNAEEFARIFEAVFGSYARSTANGAPGGDFSEFFEALFGAWRSTAGAAWTGTVVQPQRGQDIESALVVSLAEAYQGATRLLRLASGSRVEVRVPPGVDTGTRMRLAGQGGRGIGGGPDGDLYLRVQVTPEPGFLRAGDDLRTTVAIDLLTAARGGQVDVATPGRKVLLRIPPRTKDGQVLRLAGQGMPKLHNPAQRGDLYVRAAVQEPQRPTPQEQELLRELRGGPVSGQQAPASAPRWLVGRRLEVGLVATGLVALLLQVAGLNGAIWLLPAALVLAVAGLVTRSGLVALIGGATAMLAGLLLIGGDQPVLAVLSWLWPLALVVAGGILGLRRHHDARQRTDRQGND